MMGKRGNKARKLSAREKQEKLHLSLVGDDGWQEELELRRAGETEVDLNSEVQKHLARLEDDDVIPWEEDSNNPRNDKRGWYKPAEESSKPGRHKVVVIEQSSLKVDDLCLEVYVQGPKWEEAAFAELLARSSCRQATIPDEADLVIFTGGVDVNPELYGETPHPRTDTPDEARDNSDIFIYCACLDQGIPMVGICRGAQFLHVMNGGKLFQFVDNHYGDHSMYDVQSSSTIQRVSSVHKQAVRPNRESGMEIVATSAVSRNRWSNDKDCSVGPFPDIEAFFYRDTCCFGVQGHPEYRGYWSYQQWFIKKLNEFILLNPDIDWVGGHRRMLPDLLKQRLTIKPEQKGS